MEGLGSMKSATARLSGQHVPAPARSPGGQDACMEGLRAAVADLRSSSESSLVQTALIVDRGTRLREDLAETRESFSIGVVFSEAVGRARQVLNEIGETRESGSQGDDADALAGFAANYTMQSQRDVFDSATKSPIDAVVTVVPGEAEEAGGDVEFF